MGNPEKGKYDKMREFAKKYAEKACYELNPDQEIVDMIIQGLVTNKEKYGRQYCPCRSVTGDKDEDRKKICPCHWHKREIERDGMCHCQLFVAPEKNN